MKNIKQFFTYVVVGALVIALSISCKSNEEPPAFKYSDLVGTWTGGGNSFTFGSDGRISFVYEGATYTGSVISSDMGEETSSGVSIYLYNNNELSSNTRKSIVLMFNSSSSCDVTIEEQSYSGGRYQNVNTTSLGNFTK